MSQDSEEFYACAENVSHIDLVTAVVVLARVIQRQAFANDVPDACKTSQQYLLNSAATFTAGVLDAERTPFAHTIASFIASPVGANGTKKPGLHIVPKDGEPER